MAPTKANGRNGTAAAVIDARLRPLAALYADPVRLGALLLGAWWTSNLLVGWFIGHDFATDPVQADRTDLLFIPVVVNGWHLVVHGLTGVLGLLCATGHRTALAYCAVLAVFYLGWGFLGLAGYEPLTDVVALDTFGNWVHVAEGLLLGSFVVFRSRLVGPLSVFAREAPSS